MIKNLFLASIARNTLNIFIASLDCPPCNRTIAFIPAAGNAMADNGFVTEDRNALIDAGFKVVDVELEGKTNSGNQALVVTGNSYTIVGN